MNLYMPCCYGMNRYTMLCESCGKHHYEEHNIKDVVPIVRYPDTNLELVEMIKEWFIGVEEGTCKDCFKSEATRQQVLDMTDTQECGSDMEIEEAKNQSLKEQLSQERTFQGGTCDGKTKATLYGNRGS